MLKLFLFYLFLFGIGASALISKVVCSAILVPGYRASGHHDSSPCSSLILCLPYCLLTEILILMKCSVIV